MVLVSVVNVSTETNHFNALKIKIAAERRLEMRDEMFAEVVNVGRFV